MTKLVSHLSEINTTIAAAMEEQSAATQEVGKNIMGVNQAAQETGRGSTVVLDDSRSLAAQATELEARVREFLSRVRSM
jgi:methyl-accepting chemotaxis protein